MFGKKDDNDQVLPPHSRFTERPRCRPGSNRQPTRPQLLAVA
jgi:hypothetical protein